MVDTPTSALGLELRSARKDAGRSLRSVADEAGISAAYLQKLERGEPSSPSPKILRRLTTVLGLSYSRLMVLAGFAPPVQPSPMSPLEAKLASARLTEIEERYVEAYIEGLVAKRQLRARKTGSSPSPRSTDGV